MPSNLRQSLFQPGLALVVRVCFYLANNETLLDYRNKSKYLLRLEFIWNEE